MSIFDTQFDVDIDFDRASLEFSVDLKTYEIPQSPRRLFRKPSFLSRRKGLGGTSKYAGHSFKPVDKSSHTSRTLTGIFSAFSGSSNSSNPSCLVSNTSIDLSDTTDESVKSPQRNIFGTLKFNTQFHEFDPNFETVYPPNFRSSPNSFKSLPKPILKNKNRNFDHEKEQIAKCDSIDFEEFLTNFEMSEINRLKETNNWNLKLSQLNNYYTHNRDFC